MKTALLLLLIFSAVLTADIALQAINDSDIVITNYDNYYNKQWERTIQNSSDTKYVKNEAIKLNNANRNCRNTVNSRMLKQFFRAVILFMMLIISLICFVVFGKRIKRASPQAG